MTNSSDLAAQLTVQRTATLYYQKALGQAFENLRMLGRTDIVKAIQASCLKDTRIELTTPQPKPETEDDESLW
jgi:hypothetical protein